MVIRIEAAADETTVWLSGELDHHAARQLRQQVDLAVERNRPQRLRLDFSDVSFMDSSGIGVIIGRCKNLGYSGGDVSACHLNERVDKIFTVSGLKKIIQVKE